MKLVAISHSCLEEVNRAVYRYLATAFKIDVHLIIPSFNDVGDGHRVCPPVVGEPFEATLLEPQGRHLRLRRLKGLKALLQKLGPTHILLDADPSTLIVNEVLRIARPLGAKVWCMTAENLPRQYLREAHEFLFRGKLKEAVSSVLTWALLQGTKRSLHHLFTMSHDGTRAMERMGFPGRVTRMPLGFDPKLFFPQEPARIEATRKRLGLKHRTIGYFGRLSPEKGIHLLLEAAARLKDLDWQILMDHFTHEPTPYIASLQKMIVDLGLKDRVVYFESAHRDMADYMNAADIVVLASVTTPRWKEQYGRVIPEAMACGKVPLGSSSGTIPELIGDCGYLFPEGDVTTLTSELRKLLTQDKGQLAAVGKKAAQRAKDLLSIHTQAEIWADLLKASSPASTRRHLRAVR